AVNGELTENTVVELASLRGSVMVEGEQTIYSAQGRRWRFPAKVAPMLNHLRHSGATPVKELCVLVPHASPPAVAELLRRLMDDGALVYAAGGCPFSEWVPTGATMSSLRRTSRFRPVAPSSTPHPCTARARIKWPWLPYCAHTRT